MRSELEIIERIRHQAGRARGRLHLGIGDDCAIYHPRGAIEDLLFTTDLLIEDVHFLRSHPASTIGHKALARGLSDIAAMGGQPRLLFVSLALAPWCGDRWIDRFYDGLLKLAKSSGTALAGGDLAHAGHVVCDVTVCGDVPHGAALRRDGARPSHRIYVSGRLGRPWQRHLRPAPRLELGTYLRGLGASAAMDLSDGISLDLHRLCVASEVSASITAPPVYRGSTLEQALHGGEDYELLFTVPPDVRVPARAAKVELTCIGVITRGRPGVVLLDGVPLAPRGYDHFKLKPPLH